MNALVKLFLSDKSIIAKAKETAKGKFDKYYVRVMEKIIKNGDYVTKEIARLDRMANVSLDKRDEFKMKKNILNLFVDVPSSEL